MNATGMTTLSYSWKGKSIGVHSFGFAFSAQSGSGTTGCVYNATFSIGGTVGMQK